MAEPLEDSFDAPMLGQMSVAQTHDLFRLKELADAVGLSILRATVDETEVDEDPDNELAWPDEESLVDDDAVLSWMVLSKGEVAFHSESADEVAEWLQQQAAVSGQ